jgi:Cu-Zn family superoxide dismutase
MKLLLNSVAIICLIGVPALAQVHDHTSMAAPAAVTAPAAPMAVTTPIKTADGSAIGTLSLTPAASGVLLQVDITKGLAPGWHGMHFHQTGDCSDPKFMTSGGHMNHAESKKPHGLLNPAGPDFGDMVNLYAAADGSAHGQAFSPWVRLDAGTSPTEQVLRDADGSALVIHANPDDHISQPIGGAGGRIACAVIK